MLDTRLVNGRNVTRVGFGPEVLCSACAATACSADHMRCSLLQSLRKDDGAKFSMEFVESSEPSRFGAEGAVVQYLQLAMPVFRLSKVRLRDLDHHSRYTASHVRQSFVAGYGGRGRDRIGIRMDPAAGASY